MDIDQIKKTSFAPREEVHVYVHAYHITVWLYSCAENLCVCILTGVATWVWSWCSGCVSSVCTCAVGLLLCVCGRCCWSWESCCLVKTQPHTHLHAHTNMPGGWSVLQNL